MVCIRKSVLLTFSSFLGVRSRVSILQDFIFDRMRKANTRNICM